MVRAIGYVIAVLLIALALLGVLGVDSTPREAEPEPLAEIAQPPRLQGRPTSPLPTPSMRVPGDESGGIMVRGVVRARATGKPVTGATVLSAPVTKPYLDSSDAVVTNKHGEFALRVRDGDGRYALSARAEGYESTTTVLDPKLVGGPITLEMTRGSVISGLVVDSQGTPVPGVTVMARVPWNTCTWPVGQLESPSDITLGGLGVTDGRGEFEIGGLTTGQDYDLSLASPRWILCDRAGERLQAPASGQVLEVDPKAVVVFAFPEDVWAAGELPTLMMTTGRGLKNLGLIEPASPHRQVFGFRVNPGRATGDGLRVRYYVRSAIHGAINGELAAVPGDEVTAIVRGATGTAQPTGALGLYAHFPDDTAFTGTVNIAVRRSGNTAAHSVLRLSFKEGELAPPLRLPVGQYSLQARTTAALRGGYWLPFAGTRSIVVTEASRTFELVLRGSPVRVGVESPTGTQVRGCLFRVLHEAHTGFEGGWRSSEGGESEDGYAILWLMPGTNRICASVPQVGLGAASVYVPENGELQEVVVRLEAGEGIDLLQLGRQSGAGR